MKTYNKFMLSILGSAIVVGSVSAQTWTLNGTTQPLQLTTSSNESAVAIDPLTGVASVKTAGVGPSVSVSANPGSVNVNVATTVTWSTSNFGNNLNCTRTSSPTLSGWNGASTLAAGSVSVTMPSSQQTVSLTLSCSGDNGSATNSTTVAVTQPGTGPDCTVRPPGYNSGATGLTDSRTEVRRPFFSLFNAAFPGPAGQRWDGQPSGVSDGTVLTLEFVAPTAPQDGGLQLADSPDRGGFGLFTTSISECPGHVAKYLQGSSTELDPCWGGELKPTAYWTLNSANPQSCLLVPGKTYYFNITLVGRCLNSNNQAANCGLRLYTR